MVGTGPFGIAGFESIYLTSPTFFSKITSKPAVTEHDEYAPLCAVAVLWLCAVAVLLLCAVAVL